MAAVAPGRVDTVCTDITTPEGRVAALEMSDRIDIRINNAGGPTPGDIRDRGRDKWWLALNANFPKQIESIEATADSMIKRSLQR
ncbi:MAG: hypothetical protein OEQ39_17040 [Gammaproteobacteria bacterium]|nr:hypothetical protein [Gammaproteobacteria bacterium]MDH3464490.1 hypothetical protein [Gammaproteobacteria bacterium]